jgi:hemerythrin-like domain-containing protein
MSRRHDSLIPLSRQHQHALAVAVVIKRRRGSENAEDAWRKDMAEKIRKLYSAEIMGHFDVEEAILFPEMERHLGALKLIAELRGEHQTLRELIKQLQPGVAAPLEMLDTFSTSIDLHIRKEERQLFIEFEKRMPVEEAKKVGMEIDARLLKVCPRL